MGEVYIALDPRLKRRVALKVLPESLASNRESLERFRREAESLAALNHPNIVTIYSVEEAEGTHFLTMELVDGRELQDLIAEGALERSTFFELAIALADAVAAAHAKNIVHRDLKPAKCHGHSRGAAQGARLRPTQYLLPSCIDRSSFVCGSAARFFVPTR